MRVPADPGEQQSTAAALPPPLDGIVIRSNEF
jgi:hypothetical protein